MAQHHLPDRVTALLFDAVLGLRVQRSGHVARAGVEERTATRDLALLVREGLLDPQGQTRGRYYLAGEPLTALRREVRSSRTPLEDPFPLLMDEVRRSAG